MADLLVDSWNKCLSLIREHLSETAYRNWFADIVPLQYANNLLVLQVQSQFIADNIETNYASIFSTAMCRVYGPGTRLEFRILIDRSSGASISTYSQAIEKEKLIMGRPNPTPSFVSQQINQPQMPQLDSRLNPSQTFESFVPGECNKIVRTVALAVASDPGKTAFNPLFIYGGSGVGKTHLMNAIGNQVKAIDPNKRVLYLSANDFKLQLMTASQNKQVSDFLNFYQTIDVLLIDDIQFLSRTGLEKTQEAFFHIFNHLHQSQKQIVLSSDKSPLEIKDVDERLITRFRWGFSGELKRPDFSLRRDILKTKMYRDGVSLDDNIVDFIAENVRDNVRELEGVLVSLLAFSTLNDEQISLELAEKVVSQIVDITPTCITLQDVLARVCDEFGIEEHVVLSNSRLKNTALARQVAMYLGKKLTNKPLQEVGAFFGGRTHATVLHAISTVEAQMQYDTVLRRQVEHLESRLVK